MNEQETFDFVVEKIIRQGEPSIDKDGYCRYRSTRRDGSKLKCAAGWLISDADYSPAMEGLSVKRLQRTIHIKNEGLVYRLQHCHDRAYIEASELGHGEFIDIFKKHAREVAKYFKLNQSAIDAEYPQ